MKELLQTYTSAEIAIFTVMLVIAIKWVWESRDWFHIKLKGVFAKENKIENTMEKLDETLKAVYELGDKITVLNNSVEELNNRVAKLEKDNQAMQCDVKILIKSDKDDIKSWITEKHQYFLNQGWIDPHSLDCIEKRYGHYVDEGGNSFVADLMNDIRGLPRKPQN